MQCNAMHCLDTSFPLLKSPYIKIVSDEQNPFGEFRAGCSSGVGEELPVLESMGYKSADQCM